MKTTKLKVLHITPSTNGYEEVWLIANRINRKNSLSMIEKDGELFMTGGFIIKPTPRIKFVLDSLSPEEQYQFIKDFKTEPFIKFYYDEQ